MRSRLVSLDMVFALTACVTTALAGQGPLAVAHVVIEGGPRAGVYEFKSTALTACFIRTDTTGFYDLQTTSTLSGTEHGQIRFQFKDLAQAANGTPNAQVMVFLTTVTRTSPPIFWDTQNPGHFRGNGLLTLKDSHDSVSAMFDGATADSVKITGTLSCRSPYRR